MTATCHNQSCPISLFEHTEGHGECVPATSIEPAAPERYRFTQAELLAMAKDRFGDDPKLWQFVCPQCGDVACAQDFIDAKGDPQKIGQECIGRQTGALTKPSPTNSRGCDWCAYGLFQGPWLITLPNGKEVGSFRLAPAVSDVT